MPTNSSARSALILGLGVALFFAAHAQGRADEVYKYIAKDGEVVYSQTPPRQEQLQSDDSLIRHTMKEKSAAAPSLRVTRKEGYDYCGQLRLPGPVSERTAVLQSLRHDLPQWEHALASYQDRLDAHLDRIARARASGRTLESNAKGPGESHSDIVRKLNEYRCAIDWGKGKQVELAETGPNLQREFTQTRADYERLLGKAYQDCGAETSDRGDPDFKAKEFEWHACMRKYQSELKSTKRELDRLQGLAQ
ncbi:MAG: DUF4124 domain-containing protein [Pseudomonadota bacterium]